MVGKSQMKLRNAVLDIIKTVPVVKGREDEIKTIGDGAPYSYMQHYIFPNVERIKYFVTLERHAGEATGTVNNDAHTYRSTICLLPPRASRWEAVSITIW